MGSEHYIRGDYTTQLHGDFTYAITRIQKINSSIIEYRQGNVEHCSNNPVLIVIQITYKKRHVHLVGVWKFFGIVSPKLGEIINFPFILASQMWDALNLHLGSVPDVRNIGSHDLILRYCMLQRWFGGWAKKERFLDLPLAIQDASHHQDDYIFSTGSRDPHKPSFATATGWGVDAT